MKIKKCFRCNIKKPLNQFYVHKQMADGTLNKCIDCTKQDTFNRIKLLKNDPTWVEKEKTRCREKGRRLPRKKPTKEQKRIIMKRYMEKYPEKFMAQIVRGSIKPRIKGNHLHHWSYNEIHYKDIIELPKDDHYKLHRFMIYDQERKMYRRVDNGTLLDTKESHINYFNEIKNNP